MGFSFTSVVPPKLRRQDRLQRSASLVPSQTVGSTWWSASNAMRRPWQDTGAYSQRLSHSSCHMSDPSSQYPLNAWPTGSDILTEAGVDSGVFKAHSVHGASVSATKDRGVGLSDILDMADWSRVSTFRKFYYHTTTSNNYFQSILRIADGK